MPASCRCESVVFVFLPAGCRKAANCRYCFYSQAKNQVFRRQGRLAAPIRVKLCRTDGHLGPLGRAKFHVYRCRGVGMPPQNIKNFHFLVKCRPVGATPLTDYQNFTGFYTSNYPTLVFHISCDSHHMLWSYCGETARR